MLWSGSGESRAAVDRTAVQAAQLTGLNRNTVNRLLALLHLRMAKACKVSSPFAGEPHQRHRELLGLRQDPARAVPGMHPHTFVFHLKECEFRFNHRGDNLYRVLLDLCRRRPLNYS